MLSTTNIHIDKDVKFETVNYDTFAILELEIGDNSQYKLFFSDPNDAKRALEELTKVLLALVIIEGKMQDISS